jgi:hypothetical protein
VKAAVLEAVREAALDLRRRGPARMPPPWRMFAPVGFVTEYLAAVEEEWPPPHPTAYVRAELLVVFEHPWPIEVVPVADTRRAFLQFVDRENRWGLQVEVPTVVFCKACSRGWGQVDRNPLPANRKCWGCGSEQLCAATWDHVAAVQFERAP